MIRYLIVACLLLCGCESETSGPSVNRLNDRLNLLETRHEALKAEHLKLVKWCFERVPPLPPPPGSEDDPAYQAEVIKHPDGTVELRPAPAFRKTITQLPGGRGIKEAPR